MLAPYPTEDSARHVVSSRDQLPCLIKFKLDATLHASSLYATLNLAVIPMEPLPWALIEVVYLRKPVSDDGREPKRRRKGKGKGKGKGDKRGNLPDPARDRPPVDEDTPVPDDIAFKIYWKVCGACITTASLSSPSSTSSRSRTTLCPEL